MTFDPRAALPRPARTASAAPPRPAAASAIDWDELCAREPQRVQKIFANLGALARGQLTWAEALGLGEAELLGMARTAAVDMDRRRFAEAERTFLALTLLDPFVPWFWLALGDARSRLGKSNEALEAYTRCLDECLLDQPPMVEARPASFRRGTLHAQLGQPERAFEDFVRVIELDTDQIFDGERALLAIEQLVAEGHLPRERLASVPRPR